MKRILAITGVAVVVIVVAAVVFLASNIDSIVKAGIETYGTEIIGAPVSVAEVRISPTTGEGTISGLVVRNPAGFETPTAFELGSITVAVDLESLASDTIVVSLISIVEPKVTYEIGGNGSNIDAIQGNIEAYLGASGGQGGSDAGGPNLIIERLDVTGGNVGISAALLMGKRLSANLPDVHLTDIGKDEGGATPGEVVEQVVAAISGGVAEAAQAVDLDGLLGKASGTAKDLVEGVVEKAKDVKDSLKKLFGR